MKRLTISGTKEAKTDVTIRELLDKLAKYEDLEEQGKLLKLPCSVGDKLFESRPDRGMVTEYIVNYIGYYGKDHEIFIGWRLNSGIYSNLSGVHASRIGKTVFLTKEEAEAALKNVNKTEIKENQKKPDIFMLG